MQASGFGRENQKAGADSDEKEQIRTEKGVEWQGLLAIIRLQGVHY
jgi:hypothetical protein